MAVMIIKVEQILGDLFATIPEFESKGKLLFGYGEQKELDRVILTKQLNQEKAYPLLWYNMPNTLDANNHFAEGMFEFVLAHNTTNDLFNDQRFNQVYNEVLFPYFNLVMQALDKANGISLFNLTGNIKYRYTNFPNYGSPTTFEGKDVQKQVDIWDAIKFEVKLQVKGTACDFDTIRYNLNDLKK